MNEARPLHRAVNRYLDWKRSNDRRFRPEKLEYLQVTSGRGSLGDLSPLKALDAVRYEQWDDVQIGDFAGHRMTSFALWDVDLASLEWVADFPHLRSLALKRTQITDLRPIVDHPSLRSFNYQACPFDERSWYEILPNRPRYRGPREDFPEEVWKVCRALYEAGLPIVTLLDIRGELLLSQAGWHTAKGLKSIPAEEVYAALGSHTHIDLPTFVNETRVRSGAKPYTLEQMYPEPRYPTSPPGGPPVAASE